MSMYVSDRAHNPNSLEGLNASLEDRAEFIYADGTDPQPGFTGLLCRSRCSKGVPGQCIHAAF